MTMLKERIIKQAGKKFYRYGVKRVSMDDLASSLGISKRTLYENFKDKEDILSSYLRSVKEERDKEFKAYADESSNMIEVVLKIIEYHANEELPAARFYEDVYKYYPNIHQQLQEDVNMNKFYFRKFLNKGVEQGFIRKELDIDIVAFLVEQNNYIFLRASYLKDPMAEKPKFTFKELFTTMLINFIRGISTNKGIEIIDKYIAEQNKQIR